MSVAHPEHSFGVASQYYYVNLTIAEKSAAYNQRNRTFQDTLVLQFKRLSCLPIPEQFALSAG